MPSKRPLARRVPCAAWLLVLLVVCGAGRAWAQPSSAEDLLILFPENPPFTGMVDGKPAGACVEAAQALLRKAGVRAVYQVLPWSRIYALAKIRPNTAILALARLPEREPSFTWVGVVAPFDVSFYASAARGDIRVESLDDARRYRIGTIQDDARETFLLARDFELGRELRRGANSGLLFKRLMNGEVDLVLMMDLTVPELARKGGYGMSELRRVWRLQGFSSEGLYLALSPTSSPQLVDRLRQGLQAIKDSGEYAAIWSRYR